MSIPTPSPPHPFSPLAGASAPSARPGSPATPAQPPDPDSVRVLIVDDLPEKLLVYRSILEEPGLEVVAARSGADALRELLQTEFAVILLDVNMPGMDGFETVSLIRGRKRCAHTPIIFVTAHSDEMHALRGYAYGAVDYILTPVVPEILRTKVGVFVDLFRKNQQVRRQQEALRELEAREHRRQLRETNQRLEVALRAGNMVACEWEGGERLLSWSHGLEEMFGFGPGEFFGATTDLLARVHPDDRDGTLAALAETLRTSGDFRIEHRIILPGGAEAWLELRGKVFKGEGERADRLAGVCTDVTERKQAEAELARHRARLEDLVTERTAELRATHERLRLADRLAAIGTLAAGLGHDMGNLLLPVRMRLDALERADLQSDSQEDVRAIASACEYLKRLSHGLRLFALNPEDSRASGERTDLATWWVEVAPFFRNMLGCEIAMDAEFAPGLAPAAIPPHVLTQAVYNLVQNAGDALRGRQGGRVVVAGRHGVWTAGALDGRGSDGAAAGGPGAAGSAIVLCVSDNGPGMDEATRLHCLEPFFTTKTRGISTGLGLALVCGAMRRIGGGIDILSTPGQGSAFRLTLPAAPVRSGGHESVAVENGAAFGAPAEDGQLACVDVADPRIRAYTATILESLGINTVPGAWAQRSRTSLAVVDEQAALPEAIDEYLLADPGRAVVVFGSAGAGNDHGRIVRLQAAPSASAIREAVAHAVRSLRSPESSHPPAGASAQTVQEALP